MRYLTLILLIICILLFSSCSGELYVSKTFWAMDTYIDIKIDSSTYDQEIIFEKCDLILDDIENTLSKNIPNSDVYKFNSSSDNIQINDTTKKVIEAAIEVSEITDGAFDITCLNVLEYWEECEENMHLPDDDVLSKLLSHCGYGKITISNNILVKSDSLTKIDLGGIGKGYASDTLVEYLKQYVDYGMVSFGSNVAVWGKKPDGTKYKIGIKNPLDTSSLIGYIDMSDGVLSVSGDYERFVEIKGQRYHHIIDPSTGYPTNNGIHSVLVICEKGIYSDALSTAFMVMGVDKALELYKSDQIDFEVLFVTDNGIVMSDGIKKIFTPIS